MRMRTLAMSTVCIVALVACGGETPPPNAPTSSGGDSSSKDSSSSDGDKKDEGGGAGKEPSGPVKEGDKAPTFSIDSLNGQGKVAVTPGKVTIVDFWATWCEPCKKSFPKLEELRVKYEASGFQIIAVSEDDEDTGIKQFGETHGAKFPLVWDKDKSIAGKYKPPNMPSSFIIDKKGIVRHVHLGYHDGEEKQIEQEVKSLL